MNIDWKNLGFALMPTAGSIRLDYNGESWSEPEVMREEHISLHIGAQALHYGQACFEGLKAFSLKDGGVGLFRPEMNARRMLHSAERICMVAPPEERFVEACLRAVELNREYVPPYGTGASLYLRPLLIGTEPMLPVMPSSTFTFLVMVSPVGPYYKEGFTPVDALILEGHDRAATHGTGQSKVAGNYAASLKSILESKARGFPINLYLDAREGKYIDEFGTSNFIGITADNTYLTPDSPSILPSITNDSLRQLAKDMGLTVRQQAIPVADLEQFVEVGACGTAAIITPIASVTHGDKTVRFGQRGADSVLARLYQELQSIQYGEVEDRHKWVTRLKSDGVSK
ncbi:MAG: branched-chain amino acid aminotransferase [Opitutales bacterium]